MDPLYHINSHIISDKYISSTHINNPLTDLLQYITVPTSSLVMNRNYGIIITYKRQIDNIGAVECIWVIDCDCWCDTDDDNSDDSDNGAAAAADDDDGDNGADDDV